MVIRILAGVAAIGAGTVHLALVPGTVLPLLLVFVIVGASQLGWGVVTLVRGSMPVPALALLGGIAPAFLFPLAAVGGDVLLAALPTAALLGATLLSLGGASLVAVHLRRSRAMGEPRRVRPALVLPALALGVAAVAGIATPAIASSELGGRSATVEQPAEQSTEPSEPASPSDAPPAPLDPPALHPGHQNH